METRSPGSMGLRVSALRLGCMGMSEFSEGRDEAEAIATLERAVEPPPTSDVSVGSTSAAQREWVESGTTALQANEWSDPNG